MQIDDEVLQSFKIGRVFKSQPSAQEDANINSISFHRSKDLLVTASNNDIIRVYDTARGIEKQTLMSKKYGVANICFTHDDYSVIYSSTKGGNAWRYHDLYTNQYIRYFQGHVGRITTLCQSPKTDQVLSAGEDKQVRLWDLRSGSCSAMLQAPGLPTVAFDEQGLVFCLGAESGVIKLYDARNYSSGPFEAFNVKSEENSNAVFSTLRFSLDGQSLLGVVEGRIYVLDAFSGETKRMITTGNVQGTGTSMEACLTADGKYILSGCMDKHIRVWSVETGDVVATWLEHAQVPMCLKFSPRKMLVASACRALVLWIPDPMIARHNSS